MFRKVAVGDVMTRNFSRTTPNSNLLECAKQMIKSRVDSLVITQSNHLLGILTQKDILWAITKKPDLNLKTVRAIDVATKKVAVIKPSADIAQAFHKMRRFGFRRLPVMTKGQVVGMLTLKDILKIDPSFYLKASDLLDVKEEEEKMRRVSHHEKENEESEGFCDNCGAFSDMLKVDGRLLCPDCRDELY